MALAVRALAAKHDSNRKYGVVLLKNSGPNGVQETPETGRLGLRVPNLKTETDLLWR